MKNMQQSLLLIPVGMDVLMSRARSSVRQFLSFLFNECSLYICDTGSTSSICLVRSRSSCSTSIMVYGMLQLKLK
jgi:hypothetical protein